MKRLFQEILNFIIKIGGLLFILLWPLTLPFILIRALFSNKIDDRKKVAIAKEIIIVFVVGVILSFIYYLSINHRTI